jgi:hypothetical protein
MATRGTRLSTAWLLQVFLALSSKQGERAHEQFGLILILPCWLRQSKRELHRWTRIRGPDQGRRCWDCAQEQK